MTEYYDTVDSDQEWDKWVKKPLIELIEITKKKDIKLIVITWDVGEHQDKLTYLLKNHSVSICDFSESLPSNPCPSSIRLSDCHLTSLGYEIIANKTLDILKEEFVS